MAILKSRRSQPKSQTTLDEPLVKKRIRLVITRKKKILADVIADEGLLRSELMQIKHLHDTKIGTLYLKIDELDESIFALRKLGDLLNKDMTLKEAEKILKERAEAEAVKRDTEDERMHEEYERMMRRTAGAPAGGVELKKLWRKLAFRFHPDLVQDDEEKKERERMMQKVNEAYARGDIAGLRLLDEFEEEAELDVDVTMEELEQTLLDLESSLKRIKQKVVALKRSEWFAWKEKLATAKKEETDLFRDLEKKLKYQIGVRSKTITDLKKQLGVA